MKHILTVIVAFIMAMMASCGKMDNGTSPTRCYFLFDTNLHPAAELTTSLRNMGVFSIVEMAPINGKAYKVVTTLYGKQRTEETVSTALETQRQTIMGMDNGLVIGRTVSDNGQLFVYDLQCRSCYDKYGTPVSRLRWGKSPELLTCSRCGTTYNLTAFGSPDREGNPLFRYPVSFDGSVLVVSH